MRFVPRSKCWNETSRISPSCRLHMIGLSHSNDKFTWEDKLVKIEELNGIKMIIELNKLLNKLLKLLKLNKHEQ